MKHISTDFAEDYIFVNGVKFVKNTIKNWGVDYEHFRT